MKVRQLEQAVKVKQLVELELKEQRLKAKDKANERILEYPIFHILSSVLLDALKSPDNSSS